MEEHRQKGVQDRKPRGGRHRRPRAGGPREARRRRAAASRSRLLAKLEDISRGGRSLVHVEQIPQRAATWEPVDPPLPDTLSAALRGLGIEQLYTHQARAVAAARAQTDFVVVTGTASGKTLCYQLPVLETILTRPGATALLLFPTKALAQDQLKSLLAVEEAAAGTLDLIAGTYDGDTPPRLRSKLRDEATVLLSNPDMLHSGILPNHARWARFFSNLAYVVCDEIHVYRGIFGSNVANVLRRLQRICRHYGANPTFICSSATIANPRELAETLTGRRFQLIDQDGAPRGRKHFVLWNPPVLTATTMERRSSNLEARDILLSFVRDGFQVLTFVRARQVTEVLLRYVQEELAKEGGGRASQVRSYRGGYLPEERREIERMLFDGELLGVVSTNALELGIDVGSLDAAVLVGYPGTIASTWQQAGRAGRTEEDSLAVLVAHNTPIDQYLMRHPEYFFSQTPEHAVIDPANAHILLGHLRAAAYELPITHSDERLFGEYAPAILKLLSEHGQVREIKGRWYYSTSGYPAADTSLRNASENVYVIVDTGEGGAPTGEIVRAHPALGAAGGTAGRPRRALGPGHRVVGTLDEASAFAQLHPQAIYMHETETYFVDDLDLNERVAYVHPVQLDYYTQSIADSRIRILETEDERRWREAETGFGAVAVSERVYLFKKIRFGSRESVGFGPVDLPVQTLETDGCWVMPPAAALAEVARYGRVPVEGLWGIAHVLGDVITLHAMCDVMDIGSTVDSRGVGVPAVFLYDRYPGGLGFSQKAFHMLEQLMEAACDLIANCPCEDGCPSCVGAPVLPQPANDPEQSGRGRIPDKEGALVILHHLLEKEPYVPKRPARSREGAAWDPVASRGEEDLPGAAPREIKPLPAEIERRLRRIVSRLPTRAPSDRSHPQPRG